jgi:hypothetical protein
MESAGFMSLTALQPRTQRRVAALTALALAAGAVVAVSQPAQAAAEYGGIRLVDSTGEVISGQEVYLYFWNDGWDGFAGIMRTDTTGTAKLSDGDYFDGNFDQPTQATISIPMEDPGTSEFVGIAWNGTALVDIRSLVDGEVPLTFRSGSSVVLDMVVPIDFPSGAITGQVVPQPAIPSQDAPNFGSFVALYDEDGLQIDGGRFGESSGVYRWSGLADGTYYAQFRMVGTSASVPRGYEAFFYDSALNIDSATPIVIANGEVKEINQVVRESTTLRGQLLLDTPSGFVPFLARPGSTTLPAVALYPVGSSPTADDALQQYTYSDPEFGTGEYRFDVPAGSYMLAFGKLATGSGKAGFTALQYYPGTTASVADAEPLELVGGTDLTVNGWLLGFGDVATGNQFINEITWLASTGISTGYPDGTFRPLASVNRDAMAAFLYRFAGSPAFTPPGVSPFRDVPTTSQFYKEITWLASTGVTTGYPDRTFRPLTPVNRDAMAAFLYRFAESPAFSAPGTSPFVDVPTNSQFYKEITWLRSTGISTGYPDSTYRPLVSVGRDAMAAFLYRFFTLPE